VVKKSISDWLDRGVINKSISAWLDRRVVNKVNFIMAEMGRVHKSRSQFQHFLKGLA
jgi:hypothetical protein